MRLALELVIAGYVLVLGWSVWKRDEIEVLPSLSWLVLMLAPFWMQFDTFPEASRSVQAFAVVFIGACLLAGDIVPVKRGRAPPADVPLADPGRLRDFRVYALLLILIAIYHVSLLDHIPLVEKYAHRVEDGRDLSWMREQTSKLLPVHTLTKYVFNWAVNIAAPLAVILAWSERRYGWALALLAVALTYAYMSLAKVPLFVLAMILLIGFLLRISRAKRAVIYVVGLLLLGAVAWDAASFFVRHPSSVLNYRAPSDRVATLNLSGADPRSRLTVGDHVRLRPVEMDKALEARERVYDYYANRLFLAPADVSSRWYQYFPAVAGQYIGLQGLTPADRERPAETHPARLVGAWAYGARFPDRYLETAQAYASVDADAYARFGIAGVIGAGCMVIGLRLLLKRLRQPHVLGETLYAIGLVLCALLWPMASLQAVLLANGLAVVIGLMLLANWVARRRYLQRFPLPDSERTQEPV